MTRVSPCIGIGEGDESYILITPPGKIHGFANGDAFEAVDAECDGLNIDG